MEPNVIFLEALPATVARSCCPNSAQEAIIGTATYTKKSAETLTSSHPDTALHSRPKTNLEHTG